MSRNQTPWVHYTSYPKSRGDPNFEFSGWTVESMTPQVLIKHCLVINDWNYEEKMCTYGNQPQKGFFIYGKKKFSCSRCVPSNPLCLFQFTNGFAWVRYLSKRTSMFQKSVRAKYLSLKNRFLGLHWLSSG